MNFPTNDKYEHLNESNDLPTSDQINTAFDKKNCPLLALLDATKEEDEPTKEDYYTEAQKEAMWYEHEQHSIDQQSVHPPHHMI